MIVFFIVAKVWIISEFCKFWYDFCCIKFGYDNKNII